MKNETNQMRVFSRERLEVNAHSFDLASLYGEIKSKL